MSLSAAIKREVQAFLSAIQFLTIIPVPSWTGWEEGRMDRASAYFPLVGMLIGAASALALMFCAAQSVSAAFVIGVWVLLTGALHEDGLADFVDGVGGGRDREHALEIMKDSRIGSYGALALIIAVLLINGAFTSRGMYSLEYGCASLIAAHTFSRALFTPVTARLEYARPADDAKVSPLSRGKPGLRGVLVQIVTCLAAFMLLISYAGGGRFGPFADKLMKGAPPILGAIAIMIAAALVIIWLMRRKIGGWTGDALGAIQVVSFTAFLLALNSLNLWQMTWRASY